MTPFSVLFSGQSQVAVLRSRGGREFFSIMENSSRFPSGPFCSVSGHCGKGGGWWAAGHSPGKAKIQECLSGLDEISKSLRGSSLGIPSSKPEV